MSRIRVPIVIAVAVLGALVVVAMVTGSTASPPTLPVVTTAPVTAATLVCPDINGLPPGTTSRATVADVAGALSPPSNSTGTVTATVLAGRKSKTKPIHVSPAAAAQRREDQSDDRARRDWIGGGNDGRRPSHREPDRTRSPAVGSAL